MLRCTACDFEFVYPPPTADQIAKVYERGYFSGQGFGYSDYSVQERRTNQRKASIRLSNLERLGVKPGMRLLDIGCAEGVFVAAAQKCGLDAWGVEISSEAISKLPEALRPRVLSGIVEAQAYAPFDAVTYWDVLEHLPNPLEALFESRQLLREGGLVAVVVPVIDNANARRWPHSWDQYKPPEHLSYFSRRSLRMVLEREIGPVVHEEPAWRRYGRLFEVARPAGNWVTRGLKQVERALGRCLVESRLLDERHFVDSVLVVARRRQQA